MKKKCSENRKQFWVRLELKDKRRKIGFIFAWNGIKEIVKSEFNFQIHLVVAIFVIGAGFIFKLASIEWAILVFAIGLVFITEAINTVIEKVIDYVKPEIHPNAKVIKDIAAASVLIAAITAVLIGFLIFFPKLYHFF